MLRGLFAFHGPMDINGTFNTITAARVRDNLGVTTLLGTKFDKIGGTLTGNLFIAPAGNAGIEHGRTDGVASTPYFDWHSGASAIDYDVRMIASGGTGVNGGGTLSFLGASFSFGGSLSAGATTFRGFSVASAGQAAFRYDDNATAQLATFNNYGVTAAGQGVSLGFNFGLSGNIAAQAAALDVVTLDTFADSTKRLTQLRFRGLNATGSLVPLMTMDATNGAVFTKRPTFGTATPWDTANFTPSGIVIDAYNEFGVRADGTDQTAKIKSALAKAFLTVSGTTGGLGGGTVVLPWGIIDVTDTITIPGYCGLKGQGPTQTTLRMATQDRAVVQVPRNNEFARIADIGVCFTGGLPSVEQATGFLFNANYGQFTNLLAKNVGNAFAIRGGNNNLLTHYFASEFSLCGLLNEGTTEVQADGSWRGAIDNFIVSGRLQNPSTTDYAKNGTVRLVNNCEGFNLDHLSCLGGVKGLVVETGDNTHGHRPQFMTITNCMFDSHVTGSYLNHCSQTRFSNVWWAGAGAQDGAGSNTAHNAYDGVQIGPGCSDLTFSGGWSNNNAGAGMSILNGAKGITVTGMTFQNNGIYGRAWGITCDGQGFIFTSNRFLTGMAGGPGSNNQKVCVVVTANASGGIIACNWSDHTYANQTSNTLQVALNVGFT